MSGIRARGTVEVAKVLVVLIAMVAAMLTVAATPARADTFEVNTLSDQVTGDCNDTECSLREAVQAANDNGQSDTITFAPGLSGTITLVQGDQSALIIENDAAGPDLTIDGPGEDQLTITQDGDTTRLLQVASGSDVSISGLTMSTGFAGQPGDDGGGIHNDGTLTINASTVTDSLAFDNGGGIYNDGGTLNINDTTISDNSAGTSGGGIYNDGGTLNINNSSITGNESFFGGAGIYNDGGTQTINNSSITGNTISRSASGGGIYNDGGTQTINNSSITGNTATDDGGGIFSEDSALAITESTIGNNGATTGSGGGLHIAGGTLTMNRSTVSTNNAGGSGGGVFSRTTALTSNPNPTGRTTITNSTVSGNTIPVTTDANRYGGGLYVGQGLTVLEHTTITDNTALAGFGGGVASRADEATRTEVGSSIIAGNMGADVSYDVPGGDIALNFFSNNYNVIGEGDATPAFDQPGDQVDVDDPMLGPLVGNGGPTQTHALEEGSPAIDRVAQGACPPPATDQRGVSRPQGTACDSGSFELGADDGGPGDGDADVICHRNAKGEPVATVKATPGHRRHLEHGRDAPGACPDGG